MMRFILIAILIYLAYRFIFNFLIPVFITAQKIRKGIREMSAGMDHSGVNTQSQSTQSSSKNDVAQPPINKPVSKEDYLDFEEIK